MNAQKIAIHFADELCRQRALTQAETDMLCAVVSQDRQDRPGKLFWTAKDDRTLRRLRRTHRAAQIAEKMGRTEQSIYSRLRTLKRADIREVTGGTA